MAHPPRFWSVCHLVALTLLMLSFAQAALAAEDVVYVDVGRAYLRKGPGVNFVERSLVSEGTRLLVETRRGDWLQVTTGLGVEGWILQRATTTTPPPEVIITDLELRIQTLQAENTSLQERIRTLADTRQDIELVASQQKVEVVQLKANIAALESRETFVWACLGVVVLLVGWGLGFFAGMSRKQLEIKHQEAMVKATRERMGT